MVILSSTGDFSENQIYQLYQDHFNIFVMIAKQNHNLQQIYAVAGENSSCIWVSILAAPI